jgi:hypothetical protein
MAILEGGIPQEKGLTDVEVGVTSSEASTSAVGPAATTSDSLVAEFSKTPTGGAMVEGVIEGAKDAKDEADAAQRTRSSRVPCNSCCTRKVKCCSACLTFLTLVAVTIGILIRVYYPQDPDWNITRLGMNQTTLDDFADVIFADGDPNKLLEFSPKVTFWNPNHVGTMTESGKMAIRFGEHTIGHATVEPKVVDAHSSGIVQVHTQMQVGSEAAGLIKEHLLVNSFELPVECDGQLRVARIGPLAVDATIHCYVLSDTLKVPNEADHEQIVIEKKCTYSYSFGF